MSDMIGRARALARLAEKATQGPWAAHVIPNSTDMWVAGALSPEGYADICDVKTGLTRGPVETAANAKLIAAAPEMAKLLGEMADELEIAQLFHRQAVLERDLERHRNTKAVDEVVVQKEVLRDLIEAATEGVALNAEQFYTAKHEAWRKEMLESIDAAKRMLEMADEVE